MKQSLLLLLFYTCLFGAQAQDAAYQQPPKAAMAYREFRQKTTVPPYGLDNVKKQIAAIKDKPGESGDEGISALTDTVYQSLSLREKFTYAMIHPEMYAQNCDINMIHANEHKEIFGYLVSEGDEETWSSRQLDFLRSNRDSVMALIRESANRSRRMGVNYKNALVEIDGWEMIPYLIDFYTADKKDKDLLTVLMLLMKRGTFMPFIRSASHKRLYGIDGNHETALEYNSANEALIIARARAYYKERKPA
ncbi:hypothetical protein LQ567_18815 [Niabella pedocola]|uniref:DUF4919 domain-containing protein n=1 Tax=Niabella pedocola TaxID=1752077 RepID=A0ABS8PUU1_9BACT|nr:hypothetical protein [Niabella pedocola]MCD2424842.1 hypothetical protein [Niabella pedocola]